MKKIILFVISLVLLVSIDGCSSKDQHSFYGTYTFEEVSYLSSLSSSSIDYLEEKMEGIKYTINDNLFKIEYADDVIIINSPDYMKEEVPDDIDSLVNDNSGEKIDYQYNIYAEDGSKTGWRLYLSSNQLWIASYVENTAEGSEIIMDIFKVS